jgi:hypothetical protein
MGNTVAYFSPKKKFGIPPFCEQKSAAYKSQAITGWIVLR